LFKGGISKGVYLNKPDRNYFFLEAGVVFFTGAFAAAFFGADLPFDLAVAIVEYH